MNTLACLLVGAALAVPAGDEKQAPKDTERLQGVWQVTAANRGGLALNAKFDLPSYTFAIVGDRYVFMTHGGTFTLDTEKGHFDLQVTAGRYSGKTLPCRYELKDDTLTITLPSSIINPMRPDPKQGDGPVGVIYTLKRDAKATKADADKALKDRIAALPDKAGFGVKGGKGGGGFANPGGGFAPAPPPPAAAATEKLLERILERLERIEQRFDALEKRLPSAQEKK
jgi:uncharacterized protein (TIGR03067 family)